MVRDDEKCGSSICSDMLQAKMSEMKRLIVDEAS